MANNRTSHPRIRETIAVAAQLKVELNTTVEQLVISF